MATSGHEMGYFDYIYIYILVWFCSSTSFDHMIISCLLFLWIRQCTHQPKDRSLPCAACSFSLSRRVKSRTILLAFSFHSAATVPNKETNEVPLHTEVTCASTRFPNTCHDKRESVCVRVTSIKFGPSVAAHALDRSHDEEVGDGARWIFCIRLTRLSKRTTT